MAYTAYRTWTTGEIVTAALMNEQVRDNGLLTAPAIMTTAGDIMYASAANTPARLAKSTTSTQYLANTGTSNVPQWNEVALATGVSGTLPVGNGGTGITSLGSNVATFLGTPSSANLRSALTDETGTGSAVFATSPTLVTPALGTPASGVLTNATGLPEAGLAVSNSPTNGYMLTAQSGDAGGMTWAAAPSGGIAAVVDDTTPQVGGSAGFDLQAQLLVGNGGSTGIAISSAGEVTMAAQPAFAAYAATTASQANVTGDGSNATVNVETEIFDQNADFNNSTMTFAAPVTGRYLMAGGIATDGNTDTTYGALTFTTSNRTWTSALPGYLVNGPNGNISALIDMDAADTLLMKFYMAGGTKNVDVLGGGTHPRTFLTGYLVA